MVSLKRGEVVAQQYEVVEQLGEESGFAYVYKVRQLGLERMRALKVLQPTLAQNARERARFREEATISARIHSDHLVEVLGTGFTDSGQPWIAMELLDGLTLESELRKHPDGLATARWKLIVRQLFHALVRVHEKQVVHADLKPANVFLARPRHHGVPLTVKILDFGISKDLNRSPMYLTSDPIGSLFWMAPEQTQRGERALPAADVWAMGLLAFNMITGQAYWRSDPNDRHVVTQYVNECCQPNLPRASERAAELGADARIPIGFDDWFVRCVCPAGTRFQNAREAFESFEHLLT
jgi:eukaryotic-like serine/threonine-protein kinase